MTESEPKKEIKVVIDTAEAEKRIRAEYEQKIANLEEANKALLEKHKKEFTPTEPKPAPTEGETARLYEPESPRIEVEGSDIDVSWVKAPNVPELMDKLNYLSKKAGNKEEFQRIQGKLLKKLVSNGKFDMTFTGSSKDFLKSPLPIREFDSEEIRQKKLAYNNRLKINRTANWKINED